MKLLLYLIGLCILLSATGCVIVPAHHDRDHDDHYYYHDDHDHGGWHDEDHGDHD